MSNFPKLENGMVVVTRNEEVALVVNDKLLFNDGYLYVSNYEKWVHEDNLALYHLHKVYSGAGLTSTDLEKYVSEYKEDVLWDKTGHMSNLKSKMAELQEELNSLG